MTSIQWGIPPNLPVILQEIPTDKPVAVLLRHSVRPPMPADGHGNDLKLTEDGHRIARELGELFGGRLQSLHSSPISRCIQTSEALAIGARKKLSVCQDRLLGDPGIFVLDGKVAGPYWLERGAKETIRDLMQFDTPLPGMAAPPPAVRFLIRHMLKATGEAPGYHVFVSHDSVQVVTASRLFPEPLSDHHWPWFLDAIFLWRDGESISVAYKDLRTTISGAHIAKVAEEDVIEFARRECAAVLGLDISARYFLAGEAFKTLITGVPPRELDLWPTSLNDRKILIDAIMQRGGRHISKQPYSDLYEVRDRLADIPHKVEPNQLEERLSRFDIALSAIGVEHCPNKGWRAIIHPEAMKSILGGDRVRQKAPVKSAKSKG